MLESPCNVTSATVRTNIQQGLKVWNFRYAQQNGQLDIDVRPAPAAVCNVRRLNE